MQTTKQKLNIMAKKVITKLKDLIWNPVAACGIFL